MTINNSMPIGKISNNSPRNQGGSIAIEFPLIVLIFMIILWGFVAVFRLCYTQIQLDNVAYNLVNAVSKTQNAVKDTSGNIKNYLPNNFNLAQTLVTLADRYLPDSIEESDIGITIESYFYDKEKKLWVPEPYHSGVPCEVNRPINQLNKHLSVVGTKKYKATSEKNSKLLQLSLCVNGLFEDESIFPLPTSLSSSSVLIGKNL
ncbi:tight adherence pilus pseudopilin TadF [Vibrio sp. 99-8-1]|uniref:tight adherence pilus pseudopilin TadF n=1 Tax=Vibrio sp. 99-8-1 TaxID=2607602 RepID=UPI0020A24329|nr:tight adherence pilus pseudopilin TadF [Vibrio sp. 99-8-1]